MILFGQPRRTVLVAWALMASLNLSAGLIIASWPERQSDLQSVRRWGGKWLVEGLNVYGLEDEAPDYPPHAIMAVSPISLVPTGWLVPLWAALNLGLALWAPYLAVRAVRPQVTGSEAWLPILMFLSWGGFRALLQFTLLALVFGLLAIVIANRRPVLSGICLGMSLMKPQIAVPFFLWTVFTRRWRIVGIALSIVLGGLAVYCLRASVNPITFLRQYAEILRTFYLGDAIMVGLAQLRPLLALATSNTAVADAIAAAIAALLLAAICVLGVAEGKRGALVMFSAPPLVGIWSLLTFYHLTYGFLLLLPTATLLLFVNDPRTVTLRRRVFWALQIGLMVDVPGVWRRVGPLLGAADTVSRALMQADRVLMLALFACVAMLAVRNGMPMSQNGTGCVGHQTDFT